MDIQPVLPTTPVRKPLKIQRDDEQKKHQPRPDSEQKEKNEQEETDNVQHIDEIV